MKTTITKSGPTARNARLCADTLSTMIRLKAPRPFDALAYAAALEVLG
jgi:hypothetical protein